MAAMRRRQKLRQRQVAKAAHLDPSYVAYLERGERSPPPARTVARLGRALGLTEPEHLVLQRLAAVERIVHSIQTNSVGLGEGLGFARLIRLAPALEPAAWSAVCKLVETLARSGRPTQFQETSMT